MQISNEDESGRDGTDRPMTIFEMISTHVSNRMSHISKTQ